MNREPFPCCVLTVNLYGPHFETSHFNELKWGLSDFIFIYYSCVTFVSLFVYTASGYNELHEVRYVRQDPPHCL